MGKRDHCCVPNCQNNRSKKTDLRFFVIPVKPQDRREAWIQAIKREDANQKGKKWTPTPNHRVCGEHFHSKQPTRVPGSRDYVPSIFPFKTPSKPRQSTQNQMAKRQLALEYENQKAVQKTNDLANINECGDQVQIPVVETVDQRQVCKFVVKGRFNKKEVHQPPPKISTGTQTTEPSTEEKLKELKSEEENLKREIASLQARIMFLEGQLNAVRLNADTLQKDDSAVQFYTGFPNFGALLTFFTVIEKDAQVHIAGGATNAVHVRQSRISLFDQFIMTLVRLRVGLSVQDLAARYGISASLFSMFFREWIVFLHAQLQAMHYVPTLEEVQSNMPKAFKSHYGDTRFILDCTEIFIQKPSHAKAQAQTWSNYKHHNTVKALVSITPDGYVNYVSTLFSGNSSDRFIVEESGFLDLVERGDGVMADRGFNIDDLLIPLGVKLNIPSFKGHRSQLSAVEVEDSRRIASVRIHIERVIGRIKNFHILDGVLPLTLKPLLNDIFGTCCYLVNYQTPVVNVGR